MDEGSVKNAGVLPLYWAMAKVARRKAPVTRSFTCTCAVWLGAPAVARIRTRAMPVSSVAVTTFEVSLGGSCAMKGGDSMKVKLPDTTSNLTPRAASGMPPWDRLTRTSASLPVQTAGEQLADWVALGVIVRSLFSVPGRTVTVAVTGAAAPVSRRVRVTAVSVATGLGTRVTDRPVTPPAIGRMAWLSEVTM